MENNVTKFTDIRAANLLGEACDIILSDTDFDCAVPPAILAKQIEALIETIISTNRKEKP